MKSSFEKVGFLLSYREVCPPAEVAHLAYCFMEFAVVNDLPDPIPHEVYPDGCISVIYRRNQRLGLEMILLKGLSLEPFYTQVFAGDVHWGVRLLPSAAAAVLRCDPTAIKTRPVSDSQGQLDVTSGLLEKLHECEDFCEAQSVLTATLLGLNIAPEQIDPRVSAAVKLISDTNGEARVSEISRSIGISQRQLERLFKESSGITLKQFARLQRFRVTAKNILENDFTWATRSAEMGFADQAHMNREISSLTNHSPRSFEQIVKKIDHRNIVGDESTRTE